MIDLAGEIDHVFCQSVSRVVEVDSADTTFHGASVTEAVVRSVVSGKTEKAA